MKRKVNGVVVSDHPARILGEVKDLRGRRFGHLTALEFDHKDNQGRARQPPNQWANHYLRPLAQPTNANY